MAEENIFFQYPRIAWEAFDASKNSSAEQSSYRSSYKSKARYPLPHRYRSDPDIHPNYTEPSERKLLVQSSLPKLHLTPQLTYSPPEQKKFLPFGRLTGPQKSSHTVTAHQLTASVKANHPTNQSSQHTSSHSSSWVSAIREEGIPYLSAYLKSTKTSVITNLAQVVPINPARICNMANKREDTLQGSPDDKKLHPRKPCQCTLPADLSCVHHSSVTEESIDKTSVWTTSNLINVLPASASEVTNIQDLEKTGITEAQSHSKQANQHTLDPEDEIAMESTRNASLGTHDMKETSTGTSVRLIKVLPSNDAIKSIGIQKETSKLETPMHVKPPVNVKPRLSQHYEYTPAANVSCDVYHVPIVYSEKYNIDITKLYQVVQKKKAQPPPSQPFLLDKPAQVFSAIKDKLLYQPIEAIDASSVYNLFNFVPDPIRRCQVDKIVKLMNLAPLKLPKPITWKKFFDCMLHPLLVQMMGSVLTCKLAIEEGWAINVGGGFSHYTTNIGGGLAVYDDVLVCLALISEFPNVKHILVINLDAYQSPCYKYVTSVLCKVTIIDFYCQSIEENHGYSSIVNKDIKYMGYMVRKEERKSNEYLSRFKQVVKEYLDGAEMQPSVCIYVAGTTILDDNPNTAMKFHNEGVVKRDHTMFQLMKHYNIPIAFLMGGGYQLCDVRATSSSIISLLENDMLLKKLGGKEF